jgi:hypothetical protein
VKRLGIILIAFLIVVGWCLSVSAGAVQLHRVDNSGIYALPDGAEVQDILLDGKPTTYVLVKDGTEVDVVTARPGSRVEAVIY